MRRLAIALLGISCLIFFRPSVVAAEEFFVAHWNCENLFDTVDDPNVTGDEEFTPDGPKHWTEQHLETKLDNLAKIICKMKDGRGPDVLGLCEIENRRVVEMLVERLGSLGRDYQIVHKDSPSERGIDCALVYDAKVFQLADSKFHRVDAGNTREIVEAKLVNAGVPLFVFVDHWPAQTHDESQRCIAADVLRKRLDEILATDPQADAVAVGDFNEDPDAVALKDHLHAVDSGEKMPAGNVFDTLAPIHAEGKGTFVWNDKWQMLDHILITPGMLDEAGYRWKPGSSHPVDFPELLFHSKREGAIDSPSKSYTKNNFHKDGFSDHLPVGCTIVK
jgi:endonuclease/exonuclease/phosphatase family metal-dependent hydrolase